MRLLPLLLTSGALLVSGASSAALHAQESHFIVIGVDGLGSAVLKTAATPHIAEMQKQGAWTLRARAVIPTVSSPNWASIIMGAGPVQHGITSNEWERESHAIEPTCQGTDNIFPTVFGLLHQQRTESQAAIFHQWAGFARLVERGAARTVVHRDTAPATMADAIAYWSKNKPNLLFIHLDNVDDAGHEHGWGSPEQHAAIALADKLLGDMRNAVAQSSRAASTFLLVTADHGGIGKKHGGITMPEIEIPWILVGPHVRRNYELHLPLDTYDTAATIARVFQLQTPACWIAKPVAEAFEAP